MNKRVLSIRQVVNAISQPPAIVEFNGFFNLSADVLLYDKDGNEYVGHAMYSWEGDDDDPQIADWENHAGWWIREDDKEGTIGATIIFWQPKERDNAK